MIPCEVCGQDAGTGWIAGYPPAPDSQKMALCKEHDLPEHRLAVERDWFKFMRARLAEITRNEERKYGATDRLLSIYFNSGGSLSIICSAFSITNDQAIKIITPGRENIFFPLAQVRNYALSPLPPVEDEAEPPDASPEKEDSNSTFSAGPERDEFAPVQEEPDSTAELDAPPGP